MYFNRTLEDWIGFKIDKRTKFDLTISSGLALLAAQKVKVEKKVSRSNDRCSSAVTRRTADLIYTIFAR